MNFYNFNLILESQAEDFVDQNPKMRIAYDSGIVNVNYLRWMLKALDQEPIEKIIPIVIAFDKNKQRLKNKDINQYKDVYSLQQEIQKLEKSKQEIMTQLKTDDTTVLGQFGDWLLIIPHTAESCSIWGKGTKWCTTSLEDEHFVKYAIDKDYGGLIFYLVKKGTDSRANPDSKITIGVDKEGNPIFTADTAPDGGWTVDAKNKPLTNKRLLNILGDQYPTILTTIKKYALENKMHPLKKNILSFIKNPALFDYYFNKFTEAQKFWFVHYLFENFSNLLPKIIYVKIANYLSDDEEDISLELATNKYTPKQVLLKLTKNKDYNVRLALIENPNTSRKALNVLAYDMNKKIKLKAREALTAIYGEPGNFPTF